MRFRQSVYSADNTFRHYINKNVSNHVDTVWNQVIETTLKYFWVRQKHNSTILVILSLESLSCWKRYFQAARQSSAAETCGKLRNALCQRRGANKRLASPRYVSRLDLTRTSKSPTPLFLVGVFQARRASKVEQGKPRRGIDLDQLREISSLNRHFVTAGIACRQRSSFEHVPLTYRPTYFHQRFQPIVVPLRGGNFLSVPFFQILCFSKKFRYGQSYRVGSKFRNRFSCCSRSMRSLCALVRDPR